MFDILGKKKFTFVNWGGSYQLRIETADDLAHLDELDDPFWMATSAPIYQLRADPVALDLLDANRNKRIISSELRRTCRWLFRVLRNLEAVTERRDVLTLADLNPEDPDGAALAVTARRVLSNLDKPDSPTISLKQIRSNEAILSKDALNGDGVIPPDSVPDAELQTYLKDILATTGKAAGVTGRDGVDKPLIEAFHKHAEAFLAWQRAVNEASGAEREALLPLGEATPAAYAAFDAVRSKVNEFFALCELVQVNTSLGRKTTQPEPAATVFESDEERARYLEAAPAGPPNADAELHFGEAMNPRYRARLLALRDKVVALLCGAGASPDVLTRQQWDDVCKTFAPYEEWLAKKSGAQVEALGTERLRTYLESEYRARVLSIIEQDLKVGKELAALRQLERLVLMQRWFLDVCNNFISFRDMYSLDRRAMFEIGRLVIDGRIFNFNMRVQDVNAHATAAERSGMFLLYSEVTAAPTEETFFVVTPVTSRHRGNLGLNKRGVLFDHTGRQWDTRVIKVVENPISLREAICAPFKKISQMISSAVEKISASTEKQLEGSLTKTTSDVEKGVVSGMQAPVQDAAAPTTPAAAPGPPKTEGDVPPTARARDMVMTGGVAIAALGSSFAFIAKTFADLQLKKALTAVGIGLAIVMVPVIIVAILKLRARNLSSILEASGWAINARMRLTRSLARMLAPDPVHPDSFTRLSEDLVQRALHENRIAAAFKGVKEEPDPAAKS